jgi:hypothetical protein
VVVLPVVLKNTPEYGVQYCIENFPSLLIIYILGK